MFRLTTLAAVTIAIGSTSPAWSHSKKEGTTPADGTTVQAVEAIEMRFDKPMRIIAVTVKTAGDDVAIERETGMEPVTEFRAVPAETLAPGAYEVEWRGMSGDGHPMQGSFGFTVRE